MRTNLEYRFPSNRLGFPLGEAIFRAIPPHGGESDLAGGPCYGVSVQPKGKFLPIMSLLTTVHPPSCSLRTTVRALTAFAMACGLTAMLAVAMTRTAPAQDAEVIFEKFSPSVVQLKSPDSEGSGIIIKNSGLILTNLHVAASGIPMTVSISDTDGNISKTIEGATLFRVHPTKDMALLKLDPGSTPLIAASVASADQITKPASTCFALSSPAGIGGALTNTITQGMVSTPRRKFDEEEFIQFSAAVNPGSSGGALLNRQGQLIGLITSKQQDSEGVAFAIPLAGIDWKEFVEVGKRVGNKERYQKAVEMSHRARFAGAMRMFDNPGADLSGELAVAAYHAKQALMECPSGADGFYALIEVYFIAGKQEICLALARSAFHACGASEFLSAEARSLSLLGRKKEARDVYSKALVAEDGKGSPRAAAAMAGILATEDPVDWPRVAYLAKWAISSFADSNSANKEVVELLEKATGHLPPAAVRALLAKKTPFTLEEMKKFPDKLPEAPADDDKLLTAFEAAHYKPIIASSSGLMQLRGDVTPPDDRGEDRFLTLDTPVDDVIPAAGGRIALLISKVADTVYLYDVARAFVISKTKCPAGTLEGKLVVGSLEHWVLVDKTQLRYERFKLFDGVNPVVMEPKNKKIPWDAFGAIMSPYRDDILWLLLRDKDGRVTVAVDNFDTGVVRVPDASLVPQNMIRDWATHSHPRFKIDPVAMTCAPAGGAQTFLSLDPTTFRLRPLPSNYVAWGLYFPFVTEPASFIVAQRNTISIRNRFEPIDWTDRIEEGWVQNPVHMAPFHSAPWLVQLHSSEHLMIQIRDPQSGRTLLPVRPVPYPDSANKVTRQVIGRPRYEVIAHRSSDRVFIFDFNHNLAISAKIPDFGRIEQRPLEINRKNGSVFRVPIPAENGCTFDFDKSPGNGLTVDVASKELVITDPDAAKRKKIMPFTVVVLNGLHVRTYYPFRVHDPDLFPPANGTSGK